MCAQYNPTDLSYGGGGGGYQGYPNSGPGGYTGYPNSGTGGYTGYPVPAATVTNDVREWFDAVDSDRSGRITATELQGALVNGNGQNFSSHLCDLMIGMFDQDKTGTIDVYQFQKLYDFVNQWLNTFRRYDRDGSGQIESNELHQALTDMGYRFSPEFSQFLVRKCDKNNSNKMTVDQFILSCIQIQKFTDAFRSRDAEMKGVINIAFEDFLQVALSCS